MVLYIVRRGFLFLFVFLDLYARLTPFAEKKRTVVHLKSGKTAKRKEQGRAKLRSAIFK